MRLIQTFEYVYACACVCARVRDRARVFENVVTRASSVTYDFKGVARSEKAISKFRTLVSDISLMNETFAPKLRRLAIISVPTKLMLNDVQRQEDDRGRMLISRCKVD